MWSKKIHSANLFLALWVMFHQSKYCFAVKNPYFHRILYGGKNMLINYFYDNYDKEIGFLRTSTYAKLAKCSNDTALRDLQDLVAKEMLKTEDTGKKTNYVIISPKDIRIPKITGEV
jgi:hypothetical protein